jgi:hypothetical protein
VNMQYNQNYGNYGISHPISAYIACTNVNWRNIELLFCVSDSAGDAWRYFQLLNKKKAAPDL